MEPFITTSTGKYFCPINIKPEDLDIEDVARGLSNTCRFGGQLRHFYSVAQHSVLCAEYAKNIYKDHKLEIACLFHDLAEAYIGDIIKPIKDNMVISLLPHGNIVSIGEAENRVIEAFCHKYNIPFDYFSDSRIKYIDNIMLNSESHYLRGFKVYDAYPIIDQQIDPLHPKESYLQFSDYLDNNVMWRAACALT